jgi:hypothetical protein
VGVSVVRALRGGWLGSRGEGGLVSAPTPDAALDALADALAPRLFERMKKLAAEERGREADDQETLDYLASLGWRREGTPNTGV